ncbi:S8 family serine peptidase [Arthrobacter sp. KBS0702]|uniref:S8 family peptidase n=1 Tax=Arthrobacter sp. KBS0702 TaxID=2578107 RepID=UPI00110F0FFB|nr:S8 family serine peptidase [Arthrobacter sp. KBS0702]QDW30865.1 S8 family serine peptidase [Arthrobacter sp. KBS0702]
MFTTVRKFFPRPQKTLVAAGWRRPRPGASSPPPDSTRPLRFLAASAALVLATGGGLAAAAPAAAAGPAQSYIVVLKDTAGDPGAVAAAHQGKFGVTASKVYRDAVNGYAGTMTAAQASSLAADPSVDFVTLGRHFDKPLEPKAPNTEVAPFWWLRIGGNLEDAREGANRRASKDDGGSGVNVAVIDSGIDGSHPDLNVRGGVDCTSGEPVKVTPIDVMGHGTAVAGVIGARNNGSGIIGTAPGTALWSVRVVSDFGSITEASLICAIDWVTSTRRDKDKTNDIDVANISIAGPGSNTPNCGKGTDPIHYAICRSVRAGVAYAVAAGNAASDVAGTIPAAYHEVVTATAMADFDGHPGGLAPSICGRDDWSAIGQRDDQPAFFSNYAVNIKDQRHTVAAPGVCILSTAPGGYSVSHGTSFASPAVAGAMAQCIKHKACRGSGADVSEQFLDLAESYNKRHHDFGFAGDPLRPAGAKYYGYLTTITQF